MRVRVYDAPSGGENRLYYFTPEEIITTKKVGTALPTGTLHERTMIQEATPTSDATVPQGTLGVKNEYTQEWRAQTGAAAKPTLAQQIDSMRQQLMDMQFQQRKDELAAVYEQNVGAIETVETSGKVLENTNESDIIKSLQIGRSVGAGAKNYPVKLPDSRQHVKLEEGQTIEGKAFAGKGTNKEIRDRFRLENTYKVNAAEWQKVSGKAYIILEGRRQKVELHWYEANGKKVEMKVKWYLDED